MTASFHSPIGRASPAADAGAQAPGAAEDGEERERAEDAWALAIAQTLVEGVRPKLAPSSPAQPEPASAGPAARGPGADAGAAAGEGDGTVADNGAKSATAGPPLPTRISTELSDSRLGRMQLSVVRSANGLHIVINVADAHVKALIEAEQALLWKSLRDCGLRIDSVKIGSKPEAGTALAPEEAAQERALARGRGNSSFRSGGVRWRGYGAPPDEEPEDDSERVDLTA